jgi:hypothetical protein
MRCSWEDAVYTNAGVTVFNTFKGELHDVAGSTSHGAHEERQLTTWGLLGVFCCLKGCTGILPGHEALACTQQQVSSTTAWMAWVVEATGAAAAMMGFTSILLPSRTSRIRQRTVGINKGLGDPLAAGFLFHCSTSFPPAVQIVCGNHICYIYLYLRVVCTRTGPPMFELYG